MPAKPGTLGPQQQMIQDAPGLKLVIGCIVNADDPGGLHGARGVLPDEPDQLGRVGPVHRVDGIGVVGKLMGNGAEQVPRRGAEAQYVADEGLAIDDVLEDVAADHEVVGLCERGCGQIPARQVDHQVNALTLLDVTAGNREAARKQRVVNQLRDVGLANGAVFQSRRADVEDPRTRS